MRYQLSTKTEIFQLDENMKAQPVAVADSCELFAGTATELLERVNMFRYESGLVLERELKRLIKDEEVKFGNEEVA